MILPITKLVSILWLRLCGLRAAGSLQLVTRWSQNQPHSSVSKSTCTKCKCFLNGPTRPFFVYFWSFQTNSTIFTTNQCEKMSWPSSIQRWDLNPWPLEHELSPTTTWPGLLPPKWECYSSKCWAESMCWHLLVRKLKEGKISEKKSEKSLFVVVQFKLWVKLWSKPWIKNILTGLNQFKPG